MPAQLDLRACETLVVSLPDDLPRRENMLRLCERLDLSGRLLDAVKCQPGWIGCGLSHVKALRQADPSRPTLILEDDIATTEDYNSLISIPDDADALYLGCSLFAGIEMIDYIGFTGRWLAEETSEEGILRVYNMLSAHAIIYLTERYRRSAIEAIVNSVAVRGWAHDQGLARIQGDFNIYALKRPAFYQTAELQPAERAEHQEWATRFEVQTSPEGSVESVWPGGVERFMRVVREDGRLKWVWV